MQEQQLQLRWENLGKPENRLLIHVEGIANSFYMARSFAISTVPGPINPQLSDTVIPTNYQPPVVEANSFPELDLTKIYSTLQKLNPLIQTAGTKKKKNKKIKRTKSRSGIK